MTRGHSNSTYAARGGGGVFKLRTAEYRGGGGVWAMSMYAKLIALHGLLPKNLELWNQFLSLFKKLYYAVS